ncbi:hypothetical protein H4219_001883 [Mycoemilia scoparia]|uniref:Uncharacterized protein n=1 Tax=Mycoemilia scoparia TaxID=417184 RepID=A0A9W8A760_9FUNG|nr:hypothetical protein H4219_001883 [Mycoemilia scoparia]
MSIEEGRAYEWERVPKAFIEDKFGWHVTQEMEFFVYKHPEEDIYLRVRYMINKSWECYWAKDMYLWP